MIAFELSGKQHEIRERLREVIQSRVWHEALAADRQPRPANPPEAFMEIIDKEKLTALLIPKEYGGLGYDYVTVAIVLEELAAGCAGLASMIAATLHAVSPILIAGTERQKQLFLPLIASSPAGTAGFALTEPQAGSDISAICTIARNRADGYTMSGTKCSIINASIARFYMVFAVLEPDRGRAGLNAFVVPAGSRGLSIGAIEDKIGLRNAPTAEMRFEDVHIPPDHLIGARGTGYLLLMQTLDRGRAFSGAVAVGVARAAYEIALAYAKERCQFGRPIFKNQSISFSLSDMATAIEAARLMVWRACRLIDLDEDYTKASSMAKLFAAQVAEEVTARAMDIFGRYGYNKTCAIDKLWRDAKALKTIEGTDNVQRMVIASLI